MNAGGSQWRVPLAIQCVPTLILGVGVFFIPESPRWCKDTIIVCFVCSLLISLVIGQGRLDDAIKVLNRLHHSKLDPDNAFAHREYLQIKEQHDEDEDNRVTWTQMVTVPSYRKRTMIAAFVMFASQLTATLVVSGEPLSFHESSY